MPKAKNEPRFARKPEGVVPIARSATTAAALQGRMMIPPKKRSQEECVHDWPPASGDGYVPCPPAEVNIEDHDD